MNKPSKPKWYEEAMAKPAMKADKMTHMKKGMEGETEFGMEMEEMEETPMMGEHPMPMKMVLAHAYVPWQCYDRAFPPREALMRGTLFPELWGVYPIPE